MPAALRTLMAVLAFHGAPVWAAGNPETAVVLISDDDGLDPSVSAALGRALRQAMVYARHTGLDGIPPLVDLSPKNDGMLIIEGAQRLITARKFLGRGLEHLAEDNRRRAYEEFRRGVHFYRTAYPYARSDALYQDLLFYLASTADATRDRNEGMLRRCEHVGTAVEMNGGSELLDDVHRVYKECDWRPDEEESNTLTVTTVPRGANVYIDGSFTGITPLELPPLRRGEHIFTFEREGFRRASRVVLVGAKFTETRELELGLKLKPGVYRYLYPELAAWVRNSEEANPKTLKEASAALDVERLLLVLLDRTPEGARVIRTLHYVNPSGSIQRHEVPLELSEVGLEDSVSAILEAHFGTSPLGGIEEPGRMKPIYFKLGLPPIPKEEL